MSISQLYDRADGVGLAQALARRDVSPAELVDEAIARLERVNPQLNAVTSRTFDQARATSEGGGPLAGVPTIVKDLGPAMAGVRQTMGSRYFADYVPLRDDEFVRRMRGAGLRIIAKSSTPEVGLVPFTEPALFGPCRNPWNLERTPGGSSGGSGALCGAGVVPLAHGNDMGGSIRIPASCNGLIGLKPSRGRAPTTGGLAGQANADLGVSRSVRDTAALLDAVRNDEGEAFLHAIEREPARLRIALVRGPMLGHGYSPEARAAVDDAAALCESLGHSVVESEPQGVDYPTLAYSLLMLFAANTGWHFGSGNPTPERKLSRSDIEPTTQAMLAIARVVALDELTTALAHQRKLIDTMDAFMRDYDVILTPTLASPPVKIGELALTNSEKTQVAVLTRLKSRALLGKAARDIAARMFDWIPTTPVFNLTGQPAISVPLHWTSDGLPVGVQFAARLNDEATLLQLAAQLERARPWSARRPPVWAGNESIPASG